MDTVLKMAKLAKVGLHYVQLKGVSLRSRAHLQTRFILFQEFVKLEIDQKCKN